MAQADELRKVKVELSVALSDVEALRHRNEALVKKNEAQKESYGKLQERFKHLQDNIDAITAGPLREAEARFLKEKDELIARVTRLEADIAKVRMENRGKTRHIEELEAALEDKTAHGVVEDPSQLARAARELIIARETEAENGKRLMQMQRDLTSADRRSRILEDELQMMTTKSKALEEELASRIETERTKEEMRRAKEEKDQHDMAVLREQLENSEALVAGKSDELTQANDRIYDLRKKLKQCKDELDEKTESLAARVKELSDLKELYDVSQESLSRSQKAVRAAKEREEEMLHRLQGLEQNMEQFRRAKIELKEVRARLVIQDAEVSRLARNNYLALSAKSIAGSQKKEAEDKLRVTVSRALYADKKSSLETQARVRAEAEAKELRLEVLNLHRHIKVMMDQGGFKGTSLGPLTSRQGSTGGPGSSDRPPSATGKRSNTMGRSTTSRPMLTIGGTPIQDPFQDADEEDDLVADSDPETVQVTGSDLGEYIDTGRLVVQQMNSGKGTQSYHVLAPESDSVSKKLVRCSRLNQFMRRVTRRFGSAVHEEFAQPILLHTCRKLAQLVWQRRASEARFNTALVDLTALMKTTDSENRRLRSSLTRITDKISVVEPAKLRLFDLYVDALKAQHFGPNPPQDAPVMIDLANCHIGDDGVEQLVGSLLSLLPSSVPGAESPPEFVIASLDLRGNDLTDVGVQMAMRLVVPFRLHLLDARLNKVTAEGMDSVAEFLRGLDYVSHVVVDASGRVEALGIPSTSDTASVDIPVAVVVDCRHQVISEHSDDEESTAATPVAKSGHHRHRRRHGGDSTGTLDGHLSGAPAKGLLRSRSSKSGVASTPDDERARSAKGSARAQQLSPIRASTTGDFTHPLKGVTLS